MGYQVLSRKWRPKIFKDVIGQEHITTSLINSLKRNRTGHAYLFTGTRGVGKTSVARIFAKSIRCENLSPEGQACDECISCKSLEQAHSLDVIEIDGASNNSVDSMRELISNVQFLPTTGSFKVYIIDEVHMLSTSAFNALLKTLEEPPAHVIFIFATTEPDKILDTVLSRCQRFDFRSPSKEKLSQLILMIAKEESITFKSDAIVDKISFFGNGSVRDSLSILDQLLTFSENNHIDENTLFLGLGLAKQESLYELAHFILASDSAEMSKIYRQLQSENVSSEKIYHGLIDTFYELINSLMGHSSNYPYSLDDYGPQELMWIYETLSKDIGWAVKSFDLGKTLEVILHKVTARREALGEKKTITVKKKNKIEDEKPVKEKKYSWKGFLEHMHAISAAKGHNLEQGNIISEPKKTGSLLQVKLGFPRSAKVFFEFLSQKDVRNEIVKQLGVFYEVDESNIDLEFDIKDKKENFYSVANLKDKELEEKNKEAEEQIRNNPGVKMAESLFNAKVDKVVLTKKRT